LDVLNWLNLSKVLHHDALWSALIPAFLQVESAWKSQNFRCKMLVYKNFHIFRYEKKYISFFKESVFSAFSFFVFTFSFESFRKDSTSMTSLTDLTDLVGYREIGNNRWSCEEGYELLSAQPDINYHSVSISFNR